jgi:transcriptional regulator with XRE-family HTH domain
METMKMKQIKLDILSNQLRKIIEGSGLSQYRIAKECGIDKSAISRFMSGERGLSTENFDTIGQFLGLRLVSEKSRKKGK